MRSFISGIKGLTQWISVSESQLGPNCAVRWKMNRYCLTITSWTVVFPP